MKPDLSHPVFAVADKLRSSLRRGARLRFTPDEALVLLDTEIYEAVMRLERREMQKACAAASSNDNELPTTGSGSALVSAHGISAGLSASEVDPSRGASRLALEAVTQTRRLKKR